MSAPSSPVGSAADAEDGSSAGARVSRSPAPGVEPQRQSMVRRLVTAVRAGGRVLAKEIVAFGVIGVVNIFVNLAIFNLLTSGLGWAVIRSSIIATVISTTSSYFMNRHWSFSHRARSGLRREYVLFFTINGFAMVVESIILAFVEYGLGLRDPVSRNIAKLIGIGVGTIIRFVAYKRWVFRAQLVVAAKNAVTATAVKSAKKYSQKRSAKN